MPLYENQLIGGFLYQAGMVAGRLQVQSDRPCPSMSVNLLQQTPLDGAFGDLVLGSKRCFVVEFKRTEQQLHTEREKWTPDHQAIFLADKALLRQSIRGHMLAYGKQVDDIAEIRYCFYPDVFVTKGINFDRGPATEIIETIYQSGARPDCPLGFDHAQLHSYLNRLYELRDKGGDSGRRDLRASAWLYVSAGKQGVVYHVAESLGQLLSLDQQPIAEPKLQTRRSKGYEP